jgi:hypothetical protein
MSDTVLDSSRLAIPVDSEHGGIRLVVVGIFIASTGIVYAIVNALVINEGLNIIALFTAFVAAGLIARFSETALQKRWPSGRMVEVDEQRVQLVNKGTVQLEISAEQPGSVLLWRFQTKRRSRVPKGWFVLASALEQDDNFLPVYAFASPADAARIEKTFHFINLTSEKEAKAQNTRPDSLRFAGEQRRLRLAETHRWTNGAEMSLPDFETYIMRLNGQFQQWMP